MKSFSQMFHHLWTGPMQKSILLTGIGYFLVILFFENRFDYLEYQSQWQFFLDGGNPWDHSSNAYGPLHNAMAFLYQLNSKIPRLLFSLLAFIGSVYLIKQINSSSLPERSKTASFYLLLYNPILWIMFVINGCNDGMVGFLFLFGVVLYDKEKFIASALLLSLAIIYKYIPLFMLPVLCINHRRINWKFSIATLAFLVLGFGSSYLIWGEKFLNPLIFNTNRVSKILSVFRYSRGDYSLFKLFGIDNLDHLSLYLMLGSILLVFIIHLLLKWEWIVSLIITLLAVHMFYLVGHFQFNISIYFLLFYYLQRFGHVITDSARKKIFILLSWLAGTTLLYGITGGFYGRFHIIREFIGLPHFILLLITVFALASYGRFRERPAKS